MASRFDNRRLNQIVQIMCNNAQIIMLANIGVRDEVSELYSRYFLKNPDTFSVG